MLAALHRPGLLLYAAAAATAAGDSRFGTHGGHRRGVLRHGEAVRATNLPPAPLEKKGVHGIHQNKVENLFYKS